MTNMPFVSEEIYPNIIVYKNTFKDIEKVYKILKESTNDQEDRFFSKWTKWSIFGEYLNPVTDEFKYSEHYGGMLEKKVTTEIEKNQKDFLLELYDGFNLTTQDYIKRYNIDVDYSQYSINSDGQRFATWRYSGPTICKYHISNETEKHGMRYHSDYIREEGEAPGYKFAITALAYFNDDYIGGELDFAIGKKLLKYKPEAGDYIVFPSGHPEILTEDGQVYLHGVMPSEGTNKYFSRMYLQKYYDGSDEWFKNEEKYGRQVWENMQEKLKEEYRNKHPQRSEIEDGVRIR